MILFIAEGRLGNQLFQYMFLKSIQKPNEKIIVAGFNDIIDTFEVSRIINIDKTNKWRRRIVKTVRLLLSILSQLRIISSIGVICQYNENYRFETPKYSKKNGLLYKITFVKTSYFQSELFFKKIHATDLSIKNNFLKDAKIILNPVIDKHKIFVHIRRGDYKHHKVFGKNTLLPLDYFHNQIKWFLKNKKDTWFIFLSDDSDFIEKEFSYLSNKFISKNTFQIDFALMTLSNSAILSPSSYSWWGSYLMIKRDVVFAPKYWLGFESKIDYHQGTLAKFMTKIEI